MWADELCTETMRRIERQGTPDVIVPEIKRRIGDDPDHVGVLTFIGKLAAEAKRIYDSEPDELRWRADVALDVIVALCSGTKQPRRTLRPG